MKTYLNALADILHMGEKHEDRTGVGTYSLFGYQMHFDLRTGFPLVTTKKMPLRWVFEELRWFLSGSTFEPDLSAEGVDIWKEWATEEQCAKFGRQTGDLGHVYGGLWRYFDPNSIAQTNDQIATLLRGIISNPNSRRHIVTGWHPNYANEVALPPCHTIWQVKCHDNSGMSLHLYMRSADVFLGVPFNIASYALLLHMLSAVTYRYPNKLIVSFGDIHLYQNHIKQAQEQICRDPYPAPTLEVRTPLGATALDKLLNFRWSDFTLHNYRHHPKIEAPVAV